MLYNHLSTNLIIKSDDIGVRDFIRFQHCHSHVERGGATMIGCHTHKGNIMRFRDTWEVTYATPCAYIPYVSHALNYFILKAPLVPAVFGALAARNTCANGTKRVMCYANKKVSSTETF
jgi:hypothetical protein